MFNLVHKTENPSERVQRGEYIIAFTLLALTLFLRIVCIFRCHFDSDEPQHLHVVWGWAHGLLQYRDIFDNHTPLFHLLCTPIFVAFGERPEVLFVMRLAMIPLYLLALWSTYIIGQVIFSQRVGMWAAVFAGLYSPFFLCSLQFRTDDLWIVFWLLAIVLLVRGHLTQLRSFIVGFFLSLAVGVSMKTTLLLFALGVSALATVAFSIVSYSSKPNFRKLSISGLTMLLGLLLVPLSLTLFFYFKGALVPFFYGTVKHNILPGYGRWGIFQWKFFLFPIALAVLWGGSRIIVLYSTSSASIVTRRVFVLFVTGVYISALKIFWPLVERQSILPFYPLFIIIFTPIIVTVIPRWISKRFSNILPARLLSGIIVPVFIALLEIGLLLTKGTPWRNGTLYQIGLLTDVLRLTNSTDPVIDVKGEMVFRQRSFYYGLEDITRRRIKLGLITDDIPERLIATRTCVAALDGDRFLPRTRRFLNENYLPVGHLRVAGKFLTLPKSNEMHSITFNVQIPARYAILTKSGIVTGWLDGTPYSGTRFLTTGHHEFLPSSAENKFALVWAQAVERGFSPYSFSTNESL